MRRKKRLSASLVLAVLATLAVIILLAVFVIPEPYKWLFFYATFGPAALGTVVLVAKKTRKR